MSNIYRKAPVRVISSPVVDAAVIEGRARGYADGLALARQQAAEDKAIRDAEHAQALADMRSTLQNAVLSLSKASSAVATQKVESLVDVEDELFVQATRIAEIVLGAELSDASAAARAAIRRALDAETPKPVHTVRLNPEAAAAAQREGLAPEGVEIVADASLSRGGAIAVYEDGWLLAGVEDAIQRIQSVADDALEASAS